MKYRIVMRESLYTWVVLQEKHWYGWRTIGRFLPECNGFQIATNYKRILELQS